MENNADLERVNVAGRPALLLPGCVTWGKSLNPSTSKAMRIQWEQIWKFFETQILWEHKGKLISAENYVQQWAPEKAYTVIMQ